MSRKPARSRKASRRPSGRPRRLWLKLSAVVLVLGLVVLVWLDAFVRQRFESHQWRVPARVHARAVELYEGRDLERRDLRRLLGLMRYREQAGAPSPGSYVFSGNTVLLHSRGFGGDDGEPARRLRLTLDDGRIARLDVIGGGDTAIARLEPLQIGSIHPGHREDRVLVRLDEVPDILVETLLAVEDRGFYDHHGISLRGLTRAMLANIRAGGIAEGGSTLTQQLVKNFWLTRERSIARKLVEIPMALLLELHYSKDEILEAYLNEVYLGQDGARAIHGMGLAARFYFGQPLSELESHQFALLVGLLKGPSLYDPRRRPDNARARRDTVLRLAHEEGVISSAALARYQRRGLEVVPRGESALYAFPAFVDLVRRQLARDYSPEDLSGDGLVIQSTLDVLAQIAAESALSGFFDSEKLPDALNGAVVMTAPDRGDVLALVGDKAPRTAGFNRALDAVRPIGSLVKPALVLTALERPRHYHLGTRIIDDEIEVTMEDGRVWSPSNYDMESMGAMPMLDALTASRNQAMARLGLDLGLGAVIDTLNRLGVRRDMPRYPSLLLGSLELTPFEVAVMYQTLASGGFRTPLRSITEVRDPEGNTVARYPISTEAVIDPGPAFLVQWALQQVMEQGTGRYAAERLPGLTLAGKTGTSDAFRDSWFAGFSGNRLAVVWLGRDDNMPTGFTGSSGALPVWTDIMHRLPQQPVEVRPPASIQWVWLDEDGERLSASGCPGARRYPLLEASIPEASTACGGAGRAGKGVMRWFKGLFD